MGRGDNRPFYSFSGAAWAEVKEGFSDAYADFDSAFEGAEKEFGES